MKERKEEWKERYKEDNRAGLEDRKNHCIRKSSFGVVCKYNLLTPNDHYSGRTAPLTSKRCILYIYSTNIGTEYFKHGTYSPFFSFKM